MRKNLFKVVGGDKIEDIGQYILNVLEKNGELGNEELGISSNIQIAIGCDSEVKRKNVNYAITILFYDNFKRNGAHYVYKRIRVPKSTLLKHERVDQWYSDNSKFKYSGDVDVPLDKLIYLRLWNEAEYLMELGEYLDEFLRGKYYYKHDKCKYNGIVPTKLPIIHLDLNPDMGNGRNLSHKLYHSAMGMFAGSGYSVVGKPDAYASSSAADLLCK